MPAEGWMIAASIRPRPAGGAARNKNS